MFTAHCAAALRLLAWHSPTETSPTCPLYSAPRISNDDYGYTMDDIGQYACKAKQK